MNLLIVIVNYKSANLIIDCLESLVPEVEAIPGTHVVITDNASPDDSVPRLQATISERGWSSRVRLMPLDRNGGFAYGNNAGIRDGLASEDPPEFVLLLNPDTIVRPGAIQPLITYLQDHPKVGAVGSRLEDPDGTPQYSAFRFPTAVGEFEATANIGPISKLCQSQWIRLPISDQPCQIDWVAGASLMVRREVFDQIGLLDEAYFMYYEEVDFCLRMNRAGWSCWYVPESHVVHLVGQVSGVTAKDRLARRVPQYYFESRRRYYQINFGYFYAILVDLSRVAGIFLARLRQWLTFSEPNHARLYLWDTMRYAFLVRMHPLEARQVD